MELLTQYKIVIVNLDPTIGSEIKKTRPCVVVSPDEMNRHLKTVVVCPITSKSKGYPTRIRFELSQNINWIVADQIRTIDKSRITRVIGQLLPETIKKVKAVLKETYVD